MKTFWSYLVFRIFVSAAIVASPAGMGTSRIKEIESFRRNDCESTSSWHPSDGVGLSGFLSAARSASISCSRSSALPEIYESAVRRSQLLVGMPIWIRRYSGRREWGAPRYIPRRPLLLYTFLRAFQGTPNFSTVVPFALLLRPV